MYLIDTLNLSLIFFQGSNGMRYSLISRDWVADCVEIMHEAYAAVGLFCVNGCVPWCLVTVMWSLGRMVWYHWEAVTRQVSFVLIMCVFLKCHVICMWPAVPGVVMPIARLNAVSWLVLCCAWRFWLCVVYVRVCMCVHMGVQIGLSLYGGTILPGCYRNKAGEEKALDAMSIMEVCRSCVVSAIDWSVFPRVEITVI